MTSSATWSPEIGATGMTGLFYVDGRMTGDYNTGSDLFYEGAQDDFFLVNARIGIHGPDQRWAIEFWGQDLLDTQYQQVAFSAPFQGAGSVAQVQKFGSPSVATANTVFSSVLAEPRTWGVTSRSRF